MVGISALFATAAFFLLGHDSLQYVKVDRPYRHEQAYAEYFRFEAIKNPLQVSLRGR